MNTRTLNMLLAARSLLETSGVPLSSSSDALTVARNVLVAHDAAELVLAALCVEFGSGNKPSEKMSFPDLVRFVVEKFRGQDDDDSQNDRCGALLWLNHARVRFKHHGDLFDAPTTYPIVEDALEVIDLLCLRAVGRSLRSLDAVAAVEHSGVAENFRDAEKLIEAGKYQKSLERVATALAMAFWDYDIQWVTVGQAESEGALLLSGRGIDPASFLAMQRFLPRIPYPLEGGAEFNTREYGHEANWTDENARFCLGTALTVVLRLQHARPVPQARDFYDEFEDVITISVDSTTVHRFKGYRFGNGPMPGESVEYHVDQVFSGKASGFYDLGPDPKPDCPMPLPEASWIRLEHHNLRGSKFPYFGIDELWFSGTDVTVTYRESESAKSRKKYAAELNNPANCEPSDASNL